jgi:chitodextrinase
MAKKTTRQKTRKAPAKVDWVKRWHKQLRKPHYILLILGVAVLLFFGVNTLRHDTHAAADCTVSSELVNSCRPWLGAAVSGYTQVSSNPITQFDYAEQLIGHPLDIFHDYHPPGSLPLNSTEIHFADRANTYIYVNWKPAGNWADADGGDASVNADILKAANSIKSVPHKIFLTVWHEPENDVSPGTSTCPGLKGSAGSPAQYIAMWKNVETIFNNDHVTNVVWVMNYMGYKPWDCLVPQLWPGNGLVDWVTFDTYGTNAQPNWDNTVGRFYDVLQGDNTSTDNFDSKPWGVAEFGTCSMTNEDQVYQYFADAKTALDDNTYSRLKMYMLYDDTGNNAGPGCLTNSTITGAYDGTKQADFNKFANDPIFTDSGSTTPTPPDTTPPSTPGDLRLTLSTQSSISIAWNASTDNVGVAGYRVYRDGTLVSTQTGLGDTNSGLAADTNYSYSVKAYDAAGNVSGAATLTVATLATPTAPPKPGPPPIIIKPGHGSPVPITKGVTPTVTGTITFGSSGSGKTSVSVDGKKISGTSLNTTYLANGTHTVTVTTKNPNGTTTSSSQMIDVDNNLSTWQDVRDTLFGALGNQKLMNGSLWGSIGVVVIIIGFVAYRFKLHQPLYLSLRKSGKK